MNFSSDSWQQVWYVLGWTMILFLAAGTVVLLIGGDLAHRPQAREPPCSLRDLAGTSLRFLRSMPLAIAGSFSGYDRSLRPEARSY